MGYSLTSSRACLLWLYCLIPLFVLLNWREAQFHTIVSVPRALSRDNAGQAQAQLLKIESEYSSGPFAESLREETSSHSNSPIVVSLKRQSFSSTSSSSKRRRRQRRRNLLGGDNAFYTATYNRSPHKRKSLRPHNYSFIEIFGSVREAGYYYAEFQLGTPPQNFELIVDTGSTITYVPCSDCSHCGQHSNDFFQPKNSSTFRTIGCKEKLCSDKVCTEGSCAYFRHYAENSSSRGSLVEDVLGLKNPDIQSPPAKIIFGCENLESGDLYAQTADGIMGLGNAEIAIHNQLMKTQGLSNTFGLCFGGFGGGGSLILGDFALPTSSDAAESEEIIYTPMIQDPRHPTYYKVYIDSITLGTEPIELESDVLETEKEKSSYLDKDWQDLGYGIVLDSGTTFSYLPEPIFSVFVASFMKQASHLKQVPGPDPNFNDICYESSLSMLDSNFPVLYVNFSPLKNSSSSGSGSGSGSGSVLKLRPKNYLFMHDDHANAYCLGFFSNGYAGTLLGGITFRDVLVVYELGKKRVGFLSPFDCGSLSELSTHLDVKEDSISDRALASTLLKPLSDSSITEAVSSSYQEEEEEVVAAAAAAADASLPSSSSSLPYEGQKCVSVDPNAALCSADPRSFSSPTIDKWCLFGCQLVVDILFNQSTTINQYTLIQLKECFGLDELATSKSRVDDQSQDQDYMVVTGHVYDPYSAREALADSFCAQNARSRKPGSFSSAMTLSEAQYFFVPDCQGLQADVLEIAVQVCSKPKPKSARLFQLDKHYTSASDRNRQGNVSSPIYYTNDRFYRSILSDAVIAVDALKSRLNLDGIVECWIPLLGLTGVLIAWLTHSRRCSWVVRSLRAGIDSNLLLFFRR